jgi:hypothetical protein
MSVYLNGPWAFHGRRRRQALSTHVYVNKERSKVKSYVSVINSFMNNLNFMDLTIDSDASDSESDTESEYIGACL